LDDCFRDACRHLVREEEDLPRDRDDTDVPTCLQDRTLMLGQPAIALLGMHNPCGYVRLAEPPRAVVATV
jgi:hypothetical protein